MHIVHDLRDPKRVADEHEHGQVALQYTNTHYIHTQTLLVADTANHKCTQRRTTRTYREVVEYAESSKQRQVEPRVERRELATQCKPAFREPLRPSRLPDDEQIPHLKHGKDDQLDKRHGRKRGKHVLQTSAVVSIDNNNNIVVICVPAQQCRWSSDPDTSTSPQSLAGRS